MLSVVALPEAVVRVCPAAIVVSVLYDELFTDHVTPVIVAVSKNRDQSTL
jgi:hypothetical protein